MATLSSQASSATTSFKWSVIRRLKSLKNESPELLLFRKSAFPLGEAPSNYYRPCSGTCLSPGRLPLARVGRVQSCTTCSCCLPSGPPRWLVHLLVRQLGSQRQPCHGSIVHAVHPIHTEVVDWIAAFPDAFMTPPSRDGCLVVCPAKWFPARKLQVAGRPVDSTCWPSSARNRESCSCRFTSASSGSASAALFAACAQTQLCTPGC